MTYCRCCQLKYNSISSLPPIKRMQDEGIRNVSTGEMDHKSFRFILAQKLIGDYLNRKRPGRPRKRPRPTPHLLHILKADAVSTVGMSILHSVKNLCGHVLHVMAIHNFASRIERMAVIVSACGTNSNYYIISFLCVSYIITETTLFNEEPTLL